MLLDAGLGGMLQGSGDDVLHLVLECLAAVIRVDDEGAQSWEAHITPCVLQLWVQHIADPLLAMEAGGVIQALAAGPAFPTLLVSCLPCCQALHRSPRSAIVTTQLFKSIPASNSCTYCFACLELHG